MNSITTKIAMILASILSGIVIFKYASYMLVDTTLYANFKTENKVLFIASIPVGFVSLSCLMLLVTVPVMMVMQWHLSKIESFRDIW